MAVGMRLADATCGRPWKRLTSSNSHCRSPKEVDVEEQTLCSQRDARIHWSTRQGCNGGRPLRRWTFSLTLITIGPRFRQDMIVKADCSLYSIEPRNKIDMDSFRAHDPAGSLGFARPQSTISTSTVTYELQVNKYYWSEQNDGRISIAVTLNRAPLRPALQLVTRCSLFFLVISHCAQESTK